MAQLIEALAITGSRKNDGTPNASGKLWAYIPGTTSPRTLYADSDAATPLTQPVTLNAAGKATAYLTSSADLRIETSTGATLDSFNYGSRDGLVEVVSDAFTGTLPSGSQGAGGSTDLATALLALGMSLGTGNGGVDGKFHGRYGTVSTNVWEELEAIWFNVKRFGAIGDGLHDDTLNIQAALNATAAAGGGTVYLPPGTYVVSSALLLTASGVSVVGAGRTTTIIKNTSAGGDCLSVSGSDVAIDSIGISATGSTGAGIVLAASVARLTFTTFSVTGHRKGISGSAGSNVDCLFFNGLITTDLNINGSCISLTSAQRITTLSCVLTTGGGGSAIEFVTSVTNARIMLNTISGVLGTAVVLGAAQNCQIIANTLAGFSSSHSVTSGVFISFAFNSGQILGGPANLLGGSQYIDQSTSRWQTGLCSLTTSIGTTSAYTPSANLYSDHHVRGTAAGITITVNAPTGAQTDGAVINFFFENQSGGAVTWSFNAAFRTAAVAPATGTGIGVAYKYNAVAVKWVEISRGSAA